MIGALIVGIALSLSSASAKEIPSPPKSFVYSESGWLNDSELEHLGHILADFEGRTSNRLTLALLAELGDEELGDYANRLARSWEIGQDDRDNGMLLAIFVEERLIAIEVGFGLEHAVTDLTCDLIIRDILQPAFRVGDYYDGIESALYALMDASEGEFKGTGRTPSAPEAQRKTSFPLSIVVFAVLMLLGATGRFRRRLGPVIFWGGGYGGLGSRGRHSGRSGTAGPGGNGSFGGGGARGGWKK